MGIAALHSILRPVSPRLIGVTHGGYIAIKNGPYWARFLLVAAYLERNRIPSSSPLRVSGYIWSSTNSRMMLVEAV